MIKETTKPNIKPGYKKTPIGIIPEDWEVRKLISQAYVDKANINSDFEDDYINYVSLSDIENGRILPKKIEFKTAPSRAKRITEKGDVLLATVRPNLKNFAIVDKENIIASTGFAVLSYKKLDLVYLYNFLYSHQAEKQYFALTVGSNYPALNSNDVKNLKLPIPPKPEQKSIANCLSTWDSGIEKLTQLIQAKKQQKKGLMQQLFNGELSMMNGQLERVENQEDWLKGWSEVMVGELVDVYDGTHQTPKYVKEGIPFYSVEHLTADDFSKTKFISEEVFKKENERVKLEKGDVLMTRIGDIGTSKYIDWDVNASFYVTLVLFKKNSENIDFRFLHQFISSDYFQNELYRKTLHVAFPKKINLGDIKLCKILLPLLKEQTAIAEIFQTADKEIELLEQKLFSFQQQKKGLMQVLLTGEKRLVNH